MKKIILATLGMGLLAVGVNANAIGQGGIAGSATMHLSGAATNIVTHVSSSIAIGKQSAYTGALVVVGTKADTFAAGGSGVVTIDSATGLITSLGKDTQLGIVQGNVLDDSTISLDIDDGTYVGVAK